MNSDNDGIEHEARMREALLYGDKLKREYDIRMKATQQRRGKVIKISLGIITLFAGWMIYSATQRQTNGSTIQVTTLSTTINGKLYEKEAAPGDTQREYVTFEDGVRVPWDAVRVKTHKFKR